VGTFEGGFKKKKVVGENSWKIVDIFTESFRNNWENKNGKFHEFLTEFCNNKKKKTKPRKNNLQRRFEPTSEQIYDKLRYNVIVSYNGWNMNQELRFRTI
jgi:hypothetical protein